MNQRKDGIALFSYPDHVNGWEFDSLVVRFDTRKKMVHCAYNKVCSQSGSLSFAEPRNLFDEKKLGGKGF